MMERMRSLASSSARRSSSCSRASASKVDPLTHTPEEVPLDQRSGPESTVYRYRSSGSIARPESISVSSSRAYPTACRRRFSNTRRTGSGLSRAGNAVESRSIVVEQQRFRIVTVEKAQQEFIDVEPDDCSRTGEWQGAAFGFCAGQCGQFAFATPRQQQWNERLEQAAHSRFRPPGAASNHAQATVATTERLDDQAGFPPGSGVQYECGFQICPFELAHAPDSTACRATRQIPARVARVRRPTILP